MSDLNLIIEQLGNYGPLEFILNIDAAHELAEIYSSIIILVLL